MTGKGFLRNSKQKRRDERFRGGGTERRGAEKGDFGKRQRNRAETAGSDKRPGGPNTEQQWPQKKKKRKGLCPAVLGLGFYE